LENQDSPAGAERHLKLPILVVLHVTQEQEQE